MGVNSENPRDAALHELSVLRVPRLPSSLIPHPSSLIPLPCRCYYAGTARLPLPDSRNRSSTHSDQGRSCCQPDHRDIEFGRPRESTTAAAFATTRLAALLSAASRTTPVAHGASASSTPPPESGCSFAATSPASDRRLALPWRHSNPSTTSASSTFCSPRPSNRLIRVARKRAGALDRVVSFG